MDTYTKLLCALNRRQTLRQAISRVPILWKVDRQILGALGQARLRALEEMPRGAVCAEIGTWKGDFSETILRVTQPRTLHLVDPWSWTADDQPYQHDRTGPRGDDVHTAVRLRFKGDERVIVHRTTSQSFLESLPEGSLDWVYIDGDHRESAVAEDLRLAWRAVRPGGFIVGDDYYWRDQDRGFSVGAAVRTFARAVGASPTLFGGQFVFRRR
jgi:hypothetical protein